MMTIIIYPYGSGTFIYLYDVSERGLNVKREPGSVTKTPIAVPRSAEIKVGKNKGINPISDDSLSPLSISTPIQYNKTEKILSLNKTNVKVEAYLTA